ncbi:MAG: potassium transporter [Deltaproteobacteria bacterium HGW-Deltaproteobacteria-18]|jgi:trk system potassium uptake protein TrkH|nr:MAG: potassium transporter [Deltaproteobacteria bacterium HGW-Deltaproteobacteria-18]
MRWTIALHVTGLILLCVGLCMFLPLACGWYYHDTSVAPLFLSLCATVLAGAFLMFSFKRPKPLVINHREGMVIVSLGWAACAFFGALPFALGGFPSFTDAFFESVSGFTTTGASILTNIEALPKGLLFWRSLTHWLGGMGIIVLTIAILPFLGVGGMQLYKAEVPGPVADKLQPRIKDTAMSLWKVYVFFTVAQVMLLMFGGMDLFESICHAFGTMATGGFSTRNTSIAAYDSAYIDGVITFFMLVAGVNFALHFQLFRGRPLAIWRDPEFRFFAIFFLLLTAVVTFSIHNSSYSSWPEALRFGSFQVASILTTTGYATADYELWLPLSQGVLLLCMFIGGCAGSTAGGIKCMRVMLLFKHAYRELFRLVHPRAVLPLKFGPKLVKEEVLTSIWGFFVLFIVLFVLSGLALAAMGVDVLTSFAAVVACIGNIGPGLGEVGPVDNYAAIPTLGKWVLSFCMLLGRLEIYTVLVLFVPEFWRK